MKIIKNILVSLGIIFVIVVAAISYIAMGSSSFKKEYSPFAEKFLFDYSQAWKISDVEGRLSSEFLADLNSMKSRNAISLFESLGKLESISDVEINQYNSGTNGETGIFIFKAVFNNAKTAVTLTIRKNNNGIKVLGLNINITEELRNNREIAT